MDKKTITKIIQEMIVQVNFFESLPKSRNKDDKKWNDGFIFGMKHLIMSVSRILKDPKKEEIYKKLIDWDKEEDKLMGLNNKAWKEHKRKHRNL